MSYRVDFDGKAAREFKKLEAIIQRQILQWLKKHVEGTDNPRQFGKALQGKLKGLWRYRIGKYRVIVQIRDEALVVLVVTAGIRSEVYR